MKEKYKGIIYILLAAFCFALMNTFVRLSGDLPSTQKSFFRNLVALVVAVIIMKKEKTEFRYQPGNLPLLIIRATCGTLGILCNFYAVDHLVLADASMLNKMSPFFAIIFSFLFLKEKINKVQSLSVIGAFMGCLLIIKPSFTNMHMFPAFIGLLGGMGAGAAYTAVRRLGQRGEKGPFIVFFFSAFSCLSVVPYLLFHYEPMATGQLIYLILAGISAAGGQFAITAAYCHAPAKEISVFDYSQVIFSALLGFVLFRQVPDLLSILGYLLIISIAIYMFCYNTGKIKKRVNCV